MPGPEELRLAGKDEIFRGEDVAFCYAMAPGELANRPLPGSAAWLGIMAGTPISGNDRGDRLVGTGALNYDLTAASLDAGFSGIRNIHRGTSHGVEAVLFFDLAVGSVGTFLRGQSGARIQVAFCGPEDAEVAGTFEHLDILGTSGAKKP